MYRVYTKVDYADTIRDPSQIVTEEIALCESDTVALFVMRKYMEEKFLRKDLPIKEDKDGNFRVTDFGSWGKTLIAEKRSLIKMENIMGGDASQICNGGSCKLSDKIWAICSGNKIHRLTFSHSLAEHISKSGYEIKRLSYKEGKPLAINERSRTGLYGIKSTSKGIILRISLFQEIAELTRDESRSLCEIELLKGE